MIRKHAKIAIWVIPNCSLLWDSGCCRHDTAVKRTYPGFKTPWLLKAREALPFRGLEAGSCSRIRTQIYGCGRARLRGARRGIGRELSQLTAQGFDRNMSGLRQRFHSADLAGAERTGRFAAVSRALRADILYGFRGILRTSSLPVQVLILIGTWFAVALIIVPVLTAIFG
jgi:hypothetical protein